MKANELRIGNWIRTSKEEQVVDVLCDSVSTMSYQCLPYCDVAPILITEEWLIKFGYTKDKDGDFVKNKYCIGSEGWFGVAHLKYETLGVSMNERHYECISHNIKHVHQLQNIIYALTGEEL